MKGRKAAVSQKIEQEEETWQQIARYSVIRGKKSAVSRVGHAHAPLQYRLRVQSLEKTHPADAG